MAMPGLPVAQAPVAAAREALVPTAPGNLVCDTDVTLLATSLATRVSYIVLDWAAAEVKVCR
jgi:hypothetical protein